MGKIGVFDKIGGNAMQLDVKIFGLAEWLTCPIFVWENFGRDVCGLYRRAADAAHALVLSVHVCMLTMNAVAVLHLAATNGRRESNLGVNPLSDEMGTLFPASFVRRSWVPRSSVVTYFKPGVAGAASRQYCRNSASHCAKVR